jgi:hypothetical protein
VTDGGGDATDGGFVDAALRVHLRFDEPSGTVANDASGNNLHGTVLGGATWVTGRVGGALDLLNNKPSSDPTGQYVTLPPTVLVPCDDMTLSVWVNLRSRAPFARIFELDGGVAQFLFMSPTFPITNPGDPGRFFLFNIFRNVEDAGPKDQGVRGDYPTSDAGDTLLNEWHHYAITLNGQVAVAYFDGQEVGRNPNLVFNPSDIALRADGGAGGEPHAWIGRALFPDDAYLNAQLDELRISCRAYTAAEIARLAD